MEFFRKAKEAFLNVVDQRLRVIQLEDQLNLCVIEIKRLTEEHRASRAGDLIRGIRHANAVTFDSSLTPEEKLHAVRKILAGLEIRSERHLDA